MSKKYLATEETHQGIRDALETIADNVIYLKGNKGDKGDPGAKGDKGDKGDDGQDGKSFTIHSQYPTYEALIADHTAGEAGDAYFVGTDTNPDLYVWLADTEEWYNAGKIVGVKGDPGASKTFQIGTVTQGDTPSVTLTDVDDVVTLNFVFARKGGDSGGSGGSILIDPSEPVAPSEFMTELYWVNGTTTAPTAAQTKSVIYGTVPSASGTNVTSQKAVSIYNSDGTIKPAMKMSEPIMKPIILKVHVPQWYTNYAPANNTAKTASLQLTLIPPDMAQYTIYNKSNWRCLISDFDMCWEIPYQSGNSSFTVRFQNNSFVWGFFPWSDEENTGLMMVRDVDFYVYLNPQKHCVNFYYDQIDNEHLLGSLFLPADLFIEDAYVDEETGETVEAKGTRLLICGDVYYGNGCDLSDEFINGWDTSASGGNVIVPNAPIDDGFSLAGIINKDIVTLSGYGWR